MTVMRSRLSRALALVALATAGGITATIAQGDDPPATAAFHTIDGANVFERTAGAGTPTSATIVTGGTVSFANDSVEPHSVDFTAPQGVSCQQTSGGPSTSTLRFPSTPKPGAWGGTCTFTKAGVYGFFCEVHDGMTGTVVVSDAAGPPGTTTTATTITTVTATTPVVSTTTGGTSTTPAATSETPAVVANAPTAAAPSAKQTPVAAARSLSVRVASAQRGPTLRGSIAGAKAGGVVRVSLTARRGDLGLRGRKGARLAVGHLSGRAGRAGAFSFAVHLDGAGRAALARHRSLAVMAVVTAPSTAGTTVQRTFRIVVRPTAP